MTVEIDAGRWLRAMAFSPDGEFLVSGDIAGVRVWRVRDGKEVARIETRSVFCVAVSQDGSMFGAGTSNGDVLVWNAETHEQVFKYEDVDEMNIHAVDFSPDSTRLVWASDDETASVWDITMAKRVFVFHPKFDGAVIAAKYSPHGDKIVIAISWSAVRIYDSNDGSLLLDMRKLRVTPELNRGLVWLNSHLFIVSQGSVNQIDVSSGSTTSQWDVPDVDFRSCISLPRQGKFFAYSTKQTVTFWDISQHTQLSPIFEHSQNIWSIAISPDDRVLAIGGEDGKIVIENLTRVHADIQLRTETKEEHPSTPEDCHLGFAQSGHSRSEHTHHILGSRQRSEELEHHGDMAAGIQRYEEAISHYTAALSLDHSSPQLILVKRSRAFLETGSWKQALDDANQAIKFDSSSPCGFQMIHAAFHRAGQYVNAIDAFETMLSKMAKSPDLSVQQCGDQFINPDDIRATIHKIIQHTTRRLPRVLINTITGRLYDRAQQASAFELLPIFNELVSSMTTHIDYAWIKREVRLYFRYVMLSHRWEDNEPLFKQVINISVYDLNKCPTHDKLQRFCKISRDGGFNWAWSDTCCIDKSDHFVLQEALVAMFRWYQNSALVIVFLRGVYSTSQFGALVKSVWNTRAWTLQEYVAAKVIHFYTEDWTLYLNLELPDHKESPEVILEMEEATGVSAEQLRALRPGLTSIREKLRLASTRQTTLVEDAAYSLLGIFSVTGLPAIYGEGESALGRLLAHVLAVSGDVSILAWTGESGTFNSCLPAHTTVFDGPATSHLPSPIPNAELDRIIAASPTCSLDLDTALNLYERLDALSAPWFAASRMKLPCIAFQLPSLSPHRTRSGRFYRANTPAFGMVDIATRQDLSRIKTLFLVHPWLDALLEGAHSDIFTEDVVVPPTSPNADDEEMSDDGADDDNSPVPDPELVSHIAPENIGPVDEEMRAHRLIARLMQPFGALLLTPVASGRRGQDYKRVAADSLIRVQFKENVSLANILDNVRTLDVL